jgi:hypothetical protein
MHRSRAVSIEQYAAYLGEPDAYPHDPSAEGGVEAVQTHISWVFLTRERVYKLRKPARLGFLDFGTRTARNADCLREVTLNRRLAEDVYLGVSPLLETNGGVTVGPLRETLLERHPSGAPEHVVVMRRLPAGTDMLSRLQRGALERTHLDAVAETLAAFHARHGLGAPAPFNREEWLARCTSPVADNFAGLRNAACVDAADVQDAAAAARAFEETHAARFERRRKAGRAVDGHGDLHLDHVWFEGRSLHPLMIDCIEFSQRLRRIDAASDAAFLAMDLIYREHPELAERFLRRYARESDDFDLYGVVDYFIAYRAGVRAKVAALAAGAAEIPETQRATAAESARRHLELARRALARRDRGDAAVVLVCGVVGSGKSTVAELAADALDGVVISSDRVRKRRAGLRASGRTAPERKEALYSAAEVGRVYEAMLERAAPVVESGRTVVLDATYGLRARREAARAWAHERNLPLVLLEVRAEAVSVRGRLTRRAAEGTDPSDAGPDLYDASVAGFEALEPWPEARHRIVRTDAPDWRAEVRAALTQ